MLDPGYNDMANETDMFEKTLKIELIQAIIETLFPKKKEVKTLDSTKSKQSKEKK